MKKYIYTTQKDFLIEKNQPNSDIDEKVKEIILNAMDMDDFIEALRLKYGEKVPLYHATTIENSEIIDKEGLKLTHGRNFKNFSDFENLYFQIGHSDYISSNRPVLYRWDAPLDFILNFGYADMDNVDTSDDKLIELGIDIDDLNSDILDIITAFVYNDMKLDGLELLFMDVDDSGTFPTINPIKIR